ncbi:hypothetical protein [Mucilaginibacter sp. PAMB04168]|uniref:hypothetical protein n=1 Tax=Mucilaginibacter sp. PAMB04168 TaxID=3138567 RepID=UPI0031F63B5A
MDLGSEYYGPFPVLELEGTQFYINAFLHELIEVDNEQNRMDWYNDMHYLKDHVELWFDRQTKNVFWGNLFDPPEQVKLFWLYPLDAVDPDATKARLDRVVPGWDEDYPVDLPVVQIAGQDFFADPQGKEFRDTQNPWKTIPFSEVLMENGVTGVFLDKRVMQVPFPHIYDPFNPPAVLPEQIIFAAVPNGREMARLLSDEHTFLYTGSLEGQQSNGHLSR